MQNFFVKNRIKLGYVFALIAIIFSKYSIENTVREFLIGAGIAFLGQLIRLISAGYIRKNEQLSTDGTYAYVRNPLYFGSFLIYLGISIATSNPIILGIYLVFFFVVYFSTISFEEKILEEKFGEEFRAYKKQVPKFFPRILPRREQACREQACLFPTKPKFMWQQAFNKNKEYQSIVATIIIFLILWLKSWW